MAFYDLSKEERLVLVEKINQEIQNDLSSGKTENIIEYFSDEDTYIRKTGYLSIGRIFYDNPELQQHIFSTLKNLLESDTDKVRQTVVNAAGEIGKFHFNKVQYFFDIGLFDKHHSVRNAVIGSVKKMGERNPVPVLAWAKTYLKHPDKEVRREICHGIELRGRTHPQDILPLLIKKYPSIKILIAGARPTALVQSLASENVTITGWVEDIRVAYASAKIFVAPLFLGSGLQNKILEAMAMSIPCVTTTLVNNAVK